MWGPQGDPHTKYMEAYLIFIRYLARVRWRGCRGHATIYLSNIRVTKNKCVQQLGPMGF
jgi:hypothetical protein